MEHTRKEGQCDLCTKVSDRINHFIDRGSFALCDECLTNFSNVIFKGDEASSSTEGWPIELALFYALSLYEKGEQFISRDKALLMSADGAKTHSAADKLLLLIKDVSAKDHGPKFSVDIDEVLDFMRNRLPEAQRGSIFAEKVATLSFRTDVCESHFEDVAAASWLYYLRHRKKAVKEAS